MIQNPDTIISPANRGLYFSIKELWHFRQIFKNLCVREARKQFVELRFGIIWTFARPLLMTIIFIFLKRGASAAVDVDMPYPIYVFSGTLLWFTWIDAVSSTAAATRSNFNLISKIYFPRLYSPGAKAVVSISKVLPGLVPLAVFMFFYKMSPGWQLIFLPLVLIQAALLAFAIGTIFSILAVVSSDWDRLLSLLLYIGIFLSPVIYTTSMIHPAWQAVYALNPMVSVLELLRASISAHHDEVHAAHVALSLCVTVVLVSVAVFLFKRNELKMLDEL